jgi:putative ABC transport system ATP-binding protein
MDIKLLNIVRSWSGHTVLDSINLDINDGNFIAITGESGAGKTTLLSILNGIITPTEGRVYYGSRILGRMPPWERDFLRRDKLAIILQNSIVLRNLNVRDNILLPFQRYDNYKRTRERYEEYARIFKLKGKEKMFPASLSGGEIQKIAILRAVLKRSEILIADEPTGDLDTETTGRIISMFKELHRQGRTIIMTTHHPAMAAAAKDIYILENGKLRKK